MPSMALKEITEDEFPRTMSVDCSTEMLQKLKIGQYVTLTIKGIVGMLEVPPEELNEPKGEGTLGLRVLDKAVMAMSKEEKGLLALDEDEEDDA